MYALGAVGRAAAGAVAGPRPRRREAAVRLGRTRPGRVRERARRASGRRTASTRRSPPTPWRRTSSSATCPPPCRSTRGSRSSNRASGGATAAARVRQGGRPPASGDPSLDADDLFEVLADAVAIRTVADVPVGVFLSGGIDSTIVAALAARAGTTHTFTATFGRSSHDESVHAERVARALGTIHTTAAGGRRLTASTSPAAYRPSTASPSAIPRPSPPTSSPRRPRSVGVALTGDGGDELFGGYNRLVQGRPSRRAAPAACRARCGPGSRRSPAEPSRRASSGGRRRLSRTARRAPIPNLGEKLHKAAATLGAPTPRARHHRARRHVGGPGRCWSARPSAPARHRRGRLRRGAAGARPAPDAARADADQGRPGHDARRPRGAAAAARPPRRGHRAERAVRSSTSGAVPASSCCGPSCPGSSIRRLLDRPKMGFDPPIGGLAARSAADVGGRAARARRAAGDRHHRRRAGGRAAGRPISTARRARSTGSGRCSSTSCGTGPSTSGAQPRRRSRRRAAKSRGRRAPAGRRSADQPAVHRAPRPLR